MQKTRKTIEFAEDPMMQELDEAKRRIAAELEGLSPQEKAAKINKDVREYLKEMGFRLQVTRKGTYKLVKLGKK
jgi:hypothetical protein